MRERLFWVVAIATLLPVWAGKEFPTEDGPAHVYYTQVYRDLGNVDSPYHRYYERNIRWNTPNLTYFWLQYGLGKALSPSQAYRVAVSLILLGTAAAIFVLARCVASEVGLGALVGLLLTQSYFLYAGYLSFLAGIPFVVLSLALLAGPLADPGHSRKSQIGTLVGLLALGVLSFFSHLVVGAVFLLLVGLRVIFWPGASLGRRLLLALSALPVALLIVTYMLGPSTGEGGLRWMSAEEWFRSLAEVYFWHGFTAPGTAFRIRKVLLVVVIALLIWWTARLSSKSPLSTSHRFVALVGGVLLVLRCIAPDFIGQGGQLIWRLDLITATLVVPTLLDPPERVWRSTLGVAVLALVVWHLGDIIARIRRYDRAYQPVAAQATRIPKGSVIALGPPYPTELDVRFQGSYTRVFSEVVHDIGFRCRCIVVSEHHPATPYYWVRQLPSLVAKPDLLVRVDATPASSTGTRRSGLILRLTDPTPNAPSTQHQ